MKILYICHRVPFPPKRGGKIRPFNMIRHLHEHGHEVTVASLAHSTAEAQAALGLQAHCTRTIVEVVTDIATLPRMLAYALTPSPSSFGYFWSARLARRLRTELSTQKYDLIFVHCSSVAPYVAAATGTAKILDYGDIDSQKWRDYSHERAIPLRPVYWLEAIKLERTERALSKQFDFCTATTRTEMASLLGLGVTTPSGWFPNGVDAEYFTPGVTAPDAGRIAFVGRMDYFPNQQAVAWFCRNVWPALRQRHPELRFLIVGAEPSARVRELGRLPGVTVTGSVVDVRPYVQSAALTVAPLRIARGTQNKLLESMAMATPVVCSPEAVGGVDAVPGEHLLLADGADQWVAAIDGLLRTPSRRAELAHAGRARVLSHHSWASSMARMDEFINVTVQRKNLQ